MAPEGSRARTAEAAPEATLVWDVHGACIVSARDAGPADLEAIAREAGPAATGREPAGSAAPCLRVRFVDALEPRALRPVDGGAVGAAADGVYLLHEKTRAPLARVRQGAAWGEAAIVSRRGLARVPFLSHAVDLAALAAGWVPLHASAWVTRAGVGVVASGAARSGKTGALLAACTAGATPLGDDRVWLSADGASIAGLGRPALLRPWHLAGLPPDALRVEGWRRGLARALHAAARLGGPRAGAVWTDRALSRLERATVLEVDLARLGEPAGAARPRARPDVLLVLETWPDARIRAEPADPAAVPALLAAHVAAELAGLLRIQPAFHDAHPGEGWRDVERAPERAEEMLRDAVRGLPAWIVRHPYPCRLDDLHAVLSRLTPPGRPA